MNYSVRRPPVYYARDHLLGDGMNWVVPGKLIAGHYLGSLKPAEETKKLQIIVENNVTTIIDLTHPDDELDEYPVPSGIKRIQFSIEDMSGNNDIYVLKAAEATVMAMSHREGAVYVHCWGGHGRTGVVVAVAAALYLGVTAEMALYLTSLSHSTRQYVGSTGASESPQTPEQVAQVDRVLMHTGAVNGKNTPKRPYTAVARSLFGMYHEECAPPEWVLNFTNCDQYVQFAKMSACYSLDDRGGAVRKILTERQPVNIAMRPYHDVKRMQMNFGFGGNTSGYTDSFAKTKRRPPNIGVYCFSPVKVRQKTVNRHIFNSVGIALDDITQPDYISIVKSSEPDQIRREMKKIVYGAYLCMLACAKELKLMKLAICKLGGGAFSVHYPGGAHRYLNEVWLPAVIKAMREHSTLITHISILGCKDNGDIEQDEVLLHLKEKLKHVCQVTAGGLVPEDIGGGHQDDVLFQNAWDPHSVAGNGNEQDFSLDGFFGRSSAISVLTFPPTNPFIRMVESWKIQKTLAS